VEIVPRFAGALDWLGATVEQEFRSSNTSDKRLSDFVFNVCVEFAENEPRPHI